MDFTWVCWAGSGIDLRVNRGVLRDLVGAFGLAGNIFWDRWHEKCLALEKSRVKIRLAFISRWVETPCSATSR